MRNRFTHKVSIYIREKKVSAVGKPYWGFEPVQLGRGRKPGNGAFYIRHQSDTGKQHAEGPQEEERRQADFP
jgi:hypothetical protein